MEKQKIFWVILSVSVFVVVVLVVGVFLLRQKPPAIAAEPANAVHPLTDPGTSVYEYSRTSPAPGGDTEVLKLVIGGEAVPSRATTTAAPAATLPAAPEVPKVQPTARQPAPSAKPAVTAPKAAPATKPSVVAGPQFWIQTGSYRSQTLAEELARSLSEKGLAGRVFSYPSGTDTFFRVRVGPYANRQEAEKFLAIVKKIQGLESSYISMVGRAKSVN